MTANNSDFDYEQNIGKLVQHFREEQKISIEELSRISGFSHTTIRNLERGYGCRLSTLIKILRFLKKETILDSLSLETQSFSPIESHLSNREL